MSNKIVIICALGLLTLAGCKSGYNKRYTSTSEDVEAPSCTQTASNPNLIADAVKVYNLIASLTCNKATKDGALMGQNTGFGDQITGDGDRSYQALVTALGDQKPAVVSIDYEHDRIFTSEQLNNANAQLRAHWDAGGIIMISWMPLSPWKNDAQDPANSPGSSADLFFNKDGNGAVQRENLADLILTGTEANTRWLRKLDAMAAALKYFADNGIPVLWRPLPAPNTSGQYWWGLDGTYKSQNADDASLYKDLWINMYNYFTTQKQLNNLIWVYSPAEAGTLPADAPVNWAYPGETYVDVVGAIAQDDSLDIPDYDKLNELGKPLGLAQYNALPSESFGNPAQDGSLNNLSYADRLSGSYKNIAFWVTWHSYSPTSTMRSNLALIHNKNWEALGKRDYILTLKKVKDNNLR